MKRLILVVLLVLGAVAFVRLNVRDVHVHDTYFTFGPHGGQAVQVEYAAARQAKDDADEARRDALEAIEDARREVDEAAKDAAREAHEALEDAAREIRESVDGIPVPIVPGTRVTSALPAPPAPPTPPAAPAPPRRSNLPRQNRRVLVASQPQPHAQPSPAEIRKVVGRVSATEERARADARRQLQEDVATWLEPYVPASWRPSQRQLDAMVVGTRLEPVVKDYATVYVAELDADFSAGRRDELVRSHQQIVVRDRMFKLAGLLGFVLICLAAVSGYIRTDEATKGYYTNRLRMLAAAGVGAAGVVIYQMIA